MMTDRTLSISYDEQNEWFIIYKMNGFYDDADILLLSYYCYALGVKIRVEV